MTSTSTPEATILAAAQEFVDGWRRAHNRRPFSEATGGELVKLFPDEDGMRKERDAFRRTANAIRVGQGHAVSNPKPLLEIARRALRR